MSGKQSYTFIKGAFLLTVAGLVSKILSAGYRIPLQNLTGDIGFYIYQQVYPILGIVLIISLYGFPSAISQLVVDVKGKGLQLSLKSFYIPVLLLLFGINGIGFVLLYFGGSFAADWIGDIRLTEVYQLTAAAFLFVPLLALLRGVFQGNGEMKYTAYSQMGEQAIRVVTIILIAYCVGYKNMELYNIGKGGAVASMLGAVTAIAIATVPFLKQKPFTKKTYPIPWRQYMRTIFILGIVASMNHMTMLMLQLVDVMTLVPQLMDYGLSTVEAMQAKGVFDRGQPLIQLGTVLGSSFALASIPAISRKKWKENSARFYANIETALLYSFYLAAGATIGLIIVFPETNMLLFQNTKGTTSLQLLVSAIFFSSLAITAAAILQGIGYMKRTAFFIFSAVVIKWVLNACLVPLFGIYGSALATVVSLVFLFCLVYFELKRKLPQLSVFRNIHKVAFLTAVLGMTIYLYAVKYMASFMDMSRLILLFYVLFIVISGGALYLLLLLRCKAFTERQLTALPFANVLIRLHKGRDEN
ncbi:putative polysaccharide biosynthesis protein [Virgibacillus sp. W0181]|uniref:putative polysaccharide biosynthesis protein n=1 Tax=Virgibacillus sp. W0181 TaxID=3391581 RepID=UPI003F4628F9